MPYSQNIRGYASALSVVGGNDRAKPKRPLKRGRLNPGRELEAVVDLDGLWPGAASRPLVAIRRQSIRIMISKKI